MTPNKSLQVTFDPSPIFASAKMGAASNAPELKRYRAGPFDSGTFVANSCTFHATRLFSLFARAYRAAMVGAL